MKANSVNLLVMRNLQNWGVDFKKGVFEQNSSKLGMIEEAMKGLKYRQPSGQKAMGRTPRQSFYYAMQDLAEKWGK